MSSSVDFKCGSFFDILSFWVIYDWKILFTGVWTKLENFRVQVICQIHWRRNRKSIKMYWHQKKENWSENAEKFDRDNRLEILRYEVHHVFYCTYKMSNHIMRPCIYYWYIYIRYINFFQELIEWEKSGKNWPKIWCKFVKNRNIFDYVIISQIPLSS